MAGNCLIEVTQDYVDALIAILESYHASLALQARNRKLTGIVKNDNATRDNLAETSSVLFYLNYFDVSSDDCKYVHCLKEDMMSLYGFTEDDILDSFIENALLTEEGTIFLTESEDQYLTIE